MLCTFTTEHGTLIIRSDDIRAIEDSISPPGCILTWQIGTVIDSRLILGTASENRERILQEELDQVGTVELHRYRTQQLIQAQPAPRGKHAK
jgi:hypothetical protein